MDSDNIIREEGVGDTAPEEVMPGGFTPQQEAAAPQDGAGRWEPDSGSAFGGSMGSTGSDAPAGSGFGGGTGSDAPAGGGFGGGTGSDAPAGGGFGGGPDIYAPAEEKPVRKTFIRACGSWTDILPIAAVLSVLLLLLGDTASSLLHRVIPIREWALQHLGDADSVAFLMQYFDFIGIWIVFMLVIAVFKDNWPMWKAFLYNGHGNNLKAIPAGILLGFGTNGFCILMSCIMGDIKLSYNEFNPLLFFVFLLCVCIQSGAEEIVDRCYLYQKLRRRYRWPVIAVLVNALVFMALHMGNPSVTMWGLLQVFLIGVLFSLIVYYWDSLWTVIWAHTAWNFSQSIVFGLPNSGIVSKYSVFKLEAASARDGIFYSTGFGVEGSKGANAVIAALIVIVLIYGLVTKRGEKRDCWQEMENRDAGKNHIWEAVLLTVLMIAVVGTGIYVNLWMRDHPDVVSQITQQVQEQMEAEGQSAGQESGAEAPAAEQPADQQPGAETPAGQEQPAVQQPGTETPAGQEQPAVQQPGTETPAGQEQPAVQQPGAEQPAGQEQPAVQQPGAETPAGQEQPAGQQPEAEQLPEEGSPIL